MNEYPVGSLNLNSKLVDVLKENNIKYFSEVQRLVIPKLLNFNSVLALAQTGTGKTYSYVLPIINYLLNNEEKYLQSIIIAPTNFLLDQIKNVISILLNNLKISSIKLSLIKSNSDLNNNKDTNIILTTPTLFNSVIKKYDISHVKYLIIDEGDMILFDGFSNIIKDTNFFIKKGIVSIFSASINVQDISRIKSAFKIKYTFDVRNNSINTSLINHYFVSVRGLNKLDGLIKFIKEKHFDKVIVFASSKNELFKLNSYFKDNKIKSYVIHGELSKNEIKSVINNFNSSSGILLSSDYSSRGVDLDSLSDIISFSLPSDLTYYFHRAGRSGRFYTSGNSYILFDENNLDEKKKINDLIKRLIDYKMYILNNNGLKESRDSYVFKNLGKKDQSSDKLQKQIRHAVNLTKSKKIKPNYKKKVKRAVERVKEKHRRKVILTNIGKSGGNTIDFHED